MQTITIINEKGGTGKTTTAVNLAAALGERDCKVLLVDLDGQAASSRWLGVEDDTRLADALWRGSGLEPIPEVIPGVSVAPGSGKLDSVAHDLRPTQGGQLRKLLAQLTGYDYVLIDCPPSLGNRLIGNALLAASHAIVPVETSILALDGLKILLTTLDDVRDGFGHEIVLSGVLACRYDGRTRLSRLVLAELRRAMPGRVFDTVIRETVRMRECPASGVSILGYAPNCSAAADYRALATELMTARDRGLEPRGQGQPGGRDGQDEQQRLAVNDLRRQAAALVLEQHRKRGGSVPASGEEPQEADASWRCSPDEQASDEAEAVPASPPVPAETEAQVDALEPDTEAEDHQSWNPRLEEAKQVLKAVEGGPLPQPQPDAAGEPDRAAENPPDGAAREESWQERLAEAEEAVLEDDALAAAEPITVEVDVSGAGETAEGSSADDTVELADAATSEGGNIVFECVGCGAVLRVRADKAEKVGKCPACQTRIRVPTPEKADPHLQAKHAVGELASPSDQGRPAGQEGVSGGGETSEEQPESGDTLMWVIHSDEPERPGAEGEASEGQVNGGCDAAAERRRAAEELAQEVQPSWQKAPEGVPTGAAAGGGSPSSAWEDEPPGDEADAFADGPGKYPAIRKYLDEMAWRGGPEANRPGETGKKKRPAWREIFRRLTSKK